VGFSVPAHHYLGQDISTIGIKHQHGAAQALFAGFRCSYATPDKYNDSAGWTTTSLASGTYPQADVALLTSLCTDIIERLVDVCATSGIHGNPKVSI
jgi:hypothetical protein